MNDADKDAWRAIFRAWNTYDFRDSEISFFDHPDQAPAHFRYGVTDIGAADPVAFLDTMAHRFPPEGVLGVISTTSPPETQAAGRWWLRSLKPCPSRDGWLYIRM